MRHVLGWLLCPGCIIPAPAATLDAGELLASNGPARKTLRAGTDVVGWRLDRDAQWNVGAGYNGTTSAGTTPSVQGVYVQAAYLRRIAASQRLSFGPGFVAGFRGSDAGFAPIPYLHAAYEWFGPVTSGDVDLGSGTSAVVRGQAGLGAYVDVTRPPDEGGVAIIVGVSLRLPAVVAFGIP
jgi:hypothetical protein